MTKEASFIDSLRAIATHPAARGLADDAAVLELGGGALVLTHDMLVEGVHVLADQDPADIAWKLVATNLSDLAAKGAEPLGVLLGHMLGAGDDRFAAGLAEVLPWVRQWHGEIDARYGASPADIYAGFLDGQLAELQLTADAVRTWRPTGRVDITPLPASAKRHSAAPRPAKPPWRA